MNKAFVREPDEPDPRCPACGVLGVATPRPVVAAHLPLDATATLSENGFYCANPRCDVAYYDASGASVDRKFLRGGTFPKDVNAPVCPCTGLSAEQVERDARAGQRDRV